MEERAHDEASAHNGDDTTPERVLCVAFEQSEKTWKLGFTTGHGQKPRERSIAASNQAHLLQEVAQSVFANSCNEHFRTMQAPFTRRPNHPKPYRISQAHFCIDSFVGSHGDFQNTLSERAPPCPIG